MPNLDENFNVAARWQPTFRILGDLTRLRVLSAIHFEGPFASTVGELAQHTELHHATVSAALRSMEQSGPVTSKRNGRTMLYAIADEQVHHLLHVIGTNHRAANSDVDR